MANQNDSKPSNWLRLLVASGILLALFIGYYSGFFFDSGILPCAPPPGIAVDGLVTANIFTWNDINANGIQEVGEPPQPWITVEFEGGYPPTVTDENGTGRIEKFKPGCVCGCWKDEIISATLPPGYLATTSLEVKTTGEAAKYTFGFHQEENFQLTSFPDEPGWYQAFINRGVNVSTFHYSATDKTLEISLVNETNQDREEIYRNIFDIIHRLDELNIMIDRVNISFPIINFFASCRVEQVYEQEGEISYSEIIETYCQKSQP